MLGTRIRASERRPSVCTYEEADKMKFESLIAIILCIGINTGAHARYYDAAMGRFISPDTIVPKASDPQSSNRYAYVRNNPLNLVDPSGYSWLSKGWRSTE